MLVLVRVLDDGVALRDVIAGDVEDRRVLPLSLGSENLYIAII